MVDPGEQEKQKTQRWQERFARGRTVLSVSLDEALADPVLQADDDDVEDVSPSFADSQKDRALSSSLLIAPRLSLQSKQLPTVRVVPQSSELAVPAVAPASNVVTEAVVAPIKKKRLAGRNTRVQLQAVPKQEKKPTRKTTPLNEQQETAPVHTREKLSGTGVCPQGRAEVTVKNTHVTLASVVLVSLLSDPGPVVVKYHTLLPGYGFTIHLSAPVEAETHFNYAILLGELL